AVKSGGRPLIRTSSSWTVHPKVSSCLFWRWGLKRFAPTLWLKRSSGFTTSGRQILIFQKSNDGVSRRVCKPDGSPKRPPGPAASSRTTAVAGCLGKEPYRILRHAVTSPSRRDLRRGPVRFEPPRGVSAGRFQRGLTPFTFARLPREWKSPAAPCVLKVGDFGAEAEADGLQKKGTSWKSFSRQ